MGHSVRLTPQATTDPWVQRLRTGFRLIGVNYPSSSYAIQPQMEVLNRVAWSRRSVQEECRGSIKQAGRRSVPRIRIIVSANENINLILTRQPLAGTDTVKCVLICLSTMRPR